MYFLYSIICDNCTCDNGEQYEDFETHRKEGYAKN